MPGHVEELACLLVDVLPSTHDMPIREQGDVKSESLP